MPRPTIDNLFDAIVVNTQLQILITEAESGKIVWANLAYARAQGAEREEEIVGKTVHELGIWPKSLDRGEWRRRVIENGVATQRFNFMKSDGDIGASTLFTQLLQLPEGNFFVSYNIDITDIVRAEQRAITRMNRAQEIARIGDFSYDASTRLVSGSTQLGLIMGFDAQKGMTIDELLKHTHPEDRPNVISILNSRPTDYSFTSRHYRTETDIVWIETIGSATYDDEGELISWEGTIQDITDRKLAELEQDRLDEKMQEAQKLESLGILAGGVAHDFNNLLVGILGNADIALADESINEQSRDRLNDIVKTAERAAELTNQLLAYSGKGKFVIQPTDLSALVREMGELLRISISKKCKLQTYLADNLPAVEADQTQLRQVVMNLILNASEAIEHNNGLISITTGTLKCTSEYLFNADLDGVITPGDYVFVEVSDNGVGMPADIKDRLFEPFFTTKFSGRGLGMSAVMGIVRGHGGAIRIYSEPDKGTSFKVFFPAANSKAASVEEVDKPDVFDAGGKTVLVIDDDPLVADLLSRALKEMGFNVIVRADGLEGLNAFQEAPDDISLILVDLTMPRIDGVTAFNRMRQLRPDVKAILMSGYNEQDATQQLVGKGLAGFLHKPFRIADLAKVIKETL